jgi:excisionase family DNA binding protein
MEMEAENENLVLTATEAARLLRIGRATCYEQIRQGVIPSIRIGRRIIVPMAALMHKLQEALEKVG